MARGMALWKLLVALKFVDLKFTTGGLSGKSASVVNLAPKLPGTNIELVARLCVAAARACSGATGASARAHDRLALRERQGRGNWHIASAARCSVASQTLREHARHERSSAAARSS